jgi:hypothetical protein
MKHGFGKRARKLWGLADDETLVVRLIRCGKANCRACPHGYYAYAMSGLGKKRKGRYLGACNQKAEPRKPYLDTLIPLTKRIPR